MTFLNSKVTLSGASSCKISCQPGRLGVATPIQTQLLLPNGHAPQLRTTPDYAPRHHYAPSPDYLSLVPSPDYAPQHHVILDSPFSLVSYFPGTPYPMSLSTSSSSSFLAWLSIPNSHMSPNQCFPAYRNGFVTKHPTHTY